MKYKKTIISFAFFLLGLGGLQAQESLNASGGDAAGSGGTLAYSAGQVVYTTNTDSSGTVSQGVQQAYEIFTLGTEETELNISISIFPNPTANNLTLQISEYNNEKLSYQLYDMQGKLLNIGPVNAKQTQINTASLPSATYLIHIVNQENVSGDRRGKQVYSFKIIKN
ncbi:MAG: T9SS type A sorting domain-containing protein [Bacteroidetes bacterium]|jgi:hypothetical protein|nr:T9SS type A sorting domain-containing protein [Bacteroidota bacterium]